MREPTTATTVLASFAGLLIVGAIWTGAIYLLSPEIVRLINENPLAGIIITICVGYWVLDRLCAVGRSIVGWLIIKDKV